MANIVYGVAGEGRGHATRAQTIIDELRRRHRVVVCSHDLGYRMLRAAYDGSEVQVCEIPGLKFRYRGDGTLSYGRSVAGALPYLGSLTRNRQSLVQLLDSVGADLVISDFEPLTARAAKHTGVPFVSLDDQHFLDISDFSALPIGLRAKAAFIKPSVAAYYIGQAATIVSSFAFLPLRKQHPSITCVGVLMRRPVLAADKFRAEHLVAYFRRRAPARVLESLKYCGREVRVYGLGDLPDEGKLRYLPVDPEQFLVDLGSSAALVTTAGNQLVGEALFLEKPVLGIPEPGNFEQHVNGFLLEREGVGISLAAHQVKASHIERFLADLEGYRDRIVPERFVGNEAALATLERHLRGHTRARPVGKPAEVLP